MLAQLSVLSGCVSCLEVTNHELKNNKVLPFYFLSYLSTLFSLRAPPPDFVTELGNFIFNIFGRHISKTSLLSPNQVPSWFTLPLKLLRASLLPLPCFSDFLLSWNYGYLPSSLHALSCGLLLCLNFLRLLSNKGTIH